MVGHMSISPSLPNTSPCLHVLACQTACCLYFLPQGFCSCLYLARHLSFKRQLTWDPIKDALSDLSVIGTIPPISVTWSYLFLLWHLSHAIVVFLNFIHERHTHREKQRHKQREKQAPCREPDVGLDPGTPGSHPEQKADTQLLSHPGIPHIL